jgi:hypothetical protein
MSHGGWCVRKVPKKCHVLFEWPLRMRNTNQMFFWTISVWRTLDQNYFLKKSRLREFFFIDKKYSDEEERTCTKFEISNVKSSNGWWWYKQFKKQNSLSPINSTCPDHGRPQTFFQGRAKFFQGGGGKNLLFA